MVALGNFQIWSKSQHRDEIIYDTFTDTDSLTKRSRTKTSSGQQVYKIYESFNRKIFTWKKEYIKDMFYKGETNAKYADYLVFLLQEEIYTLTETQRLWGVSPSTANGNAYTIEGVVIPKMPDAGEEAYLLALLKAWHALCNRLGKKSAIIGCPAGYETDPKSIFEKIYTIDGLNYIKDKYDMVYIYKYPPTGKANTYGYRAKEFIDYWKNTLGYNGKINYLLSTYFGTYKSVDVGSYGYDSVFQDFKNAADNGADIISAYPSVNMLNEDTQAIDRLIKISKEYQQQVVNK